MTSSPTCDDDAAHDTWVDFDLEAYVASERAPDRRGQAFL